MKEEIKKIRIENYDYPLPEERIARFPLPERDSSKLLLAGKEGFSDEQFRDIPSLLPKDSLLIFNETKVIQARLLFPRSETAFIEIFCLQPSHLDIQQAMAQKHSIEYECMVGGAKKWKSGNLNLHIDDILLEAEKKEQHNGTFTIRFSWNSDDTFAELLEKTGTSPIPPYLKRKATTDDKSRYQTVFAQNDGSVAAPTASLHFTNNILDQLTEKGIKQAKLTLHVSAGTFKPVDSEEIGSHTMHAEEIIVSRDFVTYLLQNIDRHIIPVGTTAMRALESIYWLGCMQWKGVLKSSRIQEVPQWFPYEWENAPSVEESFQCLLDFMDTSGKDHIRTKTSIIIASGYEHRLCSGLITNFHQPRSTLLLLVASLLGDKWREMYQYALDHNYRFLSYGDACLIRVH